MRGFVYCGGRYYPGPIKAEDIGYPQGRGIYISGKLVHKYDPSVRDSFSRLEAEWIFEGTEHVLRAQ